MFLFFSFFLTFFLFLFVKCQCIEITFLSEVFFFCLTCIFFVSFFLYPNVFKEGLLLSVNITEQEYLTLQMASSYMKADDVSTLYISQARQLEEQGKFKEAEKYVEFIVLVQAVLLW